MGSNLSLRKMKIEQTLQYTTTEKSGGILVFLLKRVRR